MSNPNRVTTGASLALAISAFAQGAFAQDTAALGARIEDVRVDAGIPSISVAVSKCGQPSWAAAFGEADIEAHRAATPDTLYSMASVTKPITAVAVMMLAEEGRLAVDRPANSYLGEVKLVAMVGDANDATVARLMDHTAGLPPLYSLYYDDEPLRRRTSDETIARYGRIMMVPGTTERYSNLGYGVLESIIEQVSGTSYDQFVERRIFMPLGLSGIIATSSDLPVSAAVRYAAGGRRTPPYDTDMRAAANGFLTPGDLAAFGRFFLDALADRSPLLSRASAESMIAYRNEFAPSDDYDGLGFAVSRRNGHLVFGHTGSMPGVTAQLFIAPVQCLIVATAMNGFSRDVRDRTLNLVLEVYASELATTPLPSALSAEITGRWHGSIDLGDGAVISAELYLPATGGAYALVNGEQTPVRAITRQRDGYYSIAMDGGALTTEDAQRHPHRLTFRLKPDEGRLTGFVMTVALALADRDGGTFPYWSEFRRVDDSPAH